MAVVGEVVVTAPRMKDFVAVVMFIVSSGKGPYLKNS